VRRRVREQPTIDNETPHVIVICTHEGLLSSDLSTYEGWTLIIDENPNLWTFRQIATPFTWGLFSEFFKLEPCDDEWSMLRIRKDAPTVEALSKDAGISAEFRDLYRRWRSSRPLVKLTSWDQALDGRYWSWCSVWDPTRLKPFHRVMILANCFEHSLTYKLLRHAGVKLVPFEITDDRAWTPRTILVRYFAQEHQAGSGFWTNKDDPSGAEARRTAFVWIASNTDPDNHYYSANLDALNRLDLPGLKLQPKVCGSDEYKHFTCASFLYTAKPSCAEVEALSRYGITYEDVVRARQNEDLVQFLWRSWLRVPEDGRDGEFRVYDSVQARFLQEFIAATGQPFTVVLEHVADAGVDLLKPKPVGAPKKIRTEAERQAVRERRVGMEPRAEGTAGRGRLP
jgi:hypothetical protein